MDRRLNARRSRLDSRITSRQRSWKGGETNVCRGTKSRIAVCKVHIQTVDIISPAQRGPGCSSPITRVIDMKAHISRCRFKQGRRIVVILPSRSLSPTLGRSWVCKRNHLSAWIREPIPFPGLYSIPRLPVQCGVLKVAPRTDLVIHSFENMIYGCVISTFFGGARHTYHPKMNSHNQARL